DVSSAQLSRSSRNRPASCPSSFIRSTKATTTATYTLSLHDALPILPERGGSLFGREQKQPPPAFAKHLRRRSDRPRAFELRPGRSEEHTSELQSLAYLVCRLLLEKKNATGESSWSLRATSSRARRCA